MRLVKLTASWSYYKDYSTRELSWKTRPHYVNPEMVVELEPAGFAGHDGNPNRHPTTKIYLLGGVQALTTSQGSLPMQRKRCGRRLSKE